MGFALWAETTKEVAAIDYYRRVPEARHPDAKLLLSYWNTCMEQGGFLVGRDIPARPIARILSHIIVAEPLPNGSDFVVRVAGVMVRRRYGGEVQGHLLSEILSPEDFRHHNATATETIRTGQPIVVDSSLRRSNVEEMHSEVVLLPVTGRDGLTPWLLVGVFYFR